MRFFRVSKTGMATPGSYGSGTGNYADRDERQDGGQNITAVSANGDNTGSLGVDTWTALPEGPDVTSLDGVFGKTTTRFYY